MTRKTGKDARREINADLTESSAAVDPAKGLSSGSTLLNLALTGDVRAAFLPGKMYVWSGSSGSGKSLLTKTMFAEAVRNELFAGYRLVDDNVEDGSLFDVEKFWGRKVGAKIEPPRGTRAAPKFSQTAREFYYNVDECFKAKTPFIYNLDSMDALDTEEDQENFDATRKAHESGKDGPGSYGMSKAKTNSSGLRNIFGKLRDSGSIVNVITQTRDNVNPLTNKFQPQIRSGGRSLKFYAHAEMWTSVTGNITRSVRGQTRKIGIYVKVKVEKNRQTGRLVEVEIPIYWSFGIDDLGSCVDYLIDEKHWKVKQEGKNTKVKVEAPEFSAEAVTCDELVRKIDSEGLDARLRTLVGRVWRDVEREMTPDRRSKYAEDD